MFREYLQLFGTFARVGVMTFGGGYAMLPMLQKELVENHGWVTEEELADYFAIGQCTPGVIAVNTATFSGYKIKKIPGAIFATLGVIFPSIVIILILAAFLANFASFEVVKHAFAGIRVAVCILIFSSVVKLGKKSLKNWLAWVIFAVIFLLALFSGVPTVLLVVITALFGFIMSLIRVRKAAK